MFHLYVYNYTTEGRRTKTGSLLAFANLLRSNSFASTLLFTHVKNGLTQNACFKKSLPVKFKNKQRLRLHCSYGYTNKNLCTLAYRLCCS